jgi:integrase
VFTTATGRPVEPRNLVRSFIRICADNGIRLIRVHATRDAQVILGHSHISTTQQIYTHVDEMAQRLAD